MLRIPGLGFCPRGLLCHLQYLSPTCYRERAQGWRSASDRRRRNAAALRSSLASGLAEDRLAGLPGLHFPEPRLRSIDCILSAFCGTRTPRPNPLHRFLDGSRTVCWDRPRARRLPGGGLPAALRLRGGFTARPPYNPRTDQTGRSSDRFEPAPLVVNGIDLWHSQ
jgi:hypothetical protein